MNMNKIKHYICLNQTKTYQVNLTTASVVYKDRATQTYIKYNNIHNRFYYSVLAYTSYDCWCTNLKTLKHTEPQLEQKHTKQSSILNHNSVFSQHGISTHSINLDNCVHLLNVGSGSILTTISPEGWEMGREWGREWDVPFVRAM